MNIGGLYQINENYWFLYPSKDIAAARHAMHSLTEAAAEHHEELAAHAAPYWSKHLKCNVSYIEPSIFVLLDQDGKYCKILSTNGEIGWIILADWCKDDIAEVNQ